MLVWDELCYLLVLDFIMPFRACLDDAVFETVVSQNCGFVNQRDTKLWFRKKEVMRGVSKTLKRQQFWQDHGFRGYRFVVSKHPVAFENHSISPILKKYFASKQGLACITFSE